MIRVFTRGSAPERRFCDAVCCILPSLGTREEEQTWKKRKKLFRRGEASLPVQELPADIPAEVRQKLAEDLNEEATEDLKQDIREAEKEEANDEEVKADPEMLTKSRLLKLLVKKQYVKLREVTEEEQPADLAELLEELDENNRLVVFRLLKKRGGDRGFRLYVR